MIGSVGQINFAATPTDQAISKWKQYVIGNKEGNIFIEKLNYNRRRRKWR